MFLVRKCSTKIESGSMESFTYNNKYDIKILVVDHDPALLSRMRITLYKHGFTVYTAKNAISALSRFELERPNLIFIEIDLPGIDGYVALRKMLTFCRGMQHRAKFIMLTERNTKEDVIRSLEYGAHDYIVKPVTKEKLVEKLQKHIFHLEAPHPIPGNS